MRGIMGCDADLAIGTVVGNGTTAMVVRARVTDADARKLAEELGACPLRIVPGERFYEVEVQPLAPPGSAN